METDQFNDYLNVMWINPTCGDGKPEKNSRFDFRLFPRISSDYPDGDKLNISKSDLIEPEGGCVVSYFPELTLK